VIRKTLAATSVLALLWSVVVWMTGGTTLVFGGLRMSSTDPVRPLIAAALLFAVYVLVTGRQRLRDDVRHAVAAAMVRRFHSVARTTALIWSKPPSCFRV